MTWSVLPRASDALRQPRVTALKDRIPSGLETAGRVIPPQRICQPSVIIGRYGPAAPLKREQKMIVRKRRKSAALAATLMMTTNFVAPGVIAAPLQPNDSNTTTPIKHVIVIYGENRSFDHLYATYQPKSGETVRNLLSEGIIKADGSPGPNFAKAAQNQATDTDTFRIAPTKTGPYATLPPLTAGGAKSPSDTSPPFKTIAEAQDATSDLLPRDLHLLLTGATGLTSGAVDTRLANVNTLPNGPYSLTPGISYDAYAASPVHRFYQMFQQMDCDTGYATSANPSGCLNDLFPWVEVTIGAGTNGGPLAGGVTPSGEGSVAMGIYNVAQGDMPYFKYLSDNYTISDNYHQPAKGGTGLDSIIAGFGDAIWYSDGKGNAAVPPAGQIEDPNPQSGTNNVYTNDGYGSATTGKGGSYTECTDPTHPGVKPILDYLSALPEKINSSCEAGHYYLLNNYNPGYLSDGTIDTTTPFAIPPVSTPSIGDVLLANAVSFAWFGEGWNQSVAEPTNPNNVYCNICNPFNYQTKFMADPKLRGVASQDTDDFYADLHSGNLPAVSFVKPSGVNDGHPDSSKFDIFEAFTKKLLTELKKNPDLWKTTAVFITVDEGGGYYDSGYIQTLDFFGDGTRIPLIAVSPFSKGGHVKHSYTDHVSILKFIEKNWGLPTISKRSRDNLPNPQGGADPYVPANRPAIGDLMDMFDFTQS
jgi:phospholipase C